MCVPVPPSVGSQNKSAGTTPTTGSTTQPAPAIDYSQYAGMSPYDVRTRAFSGGLPTNWDWNEWMKVNPAAPDPTNHDNAGNVISAQNAALWNHAGPPAARAPNTPTSPVAAPTPAIPATPTTPTSPTTPVVSPPSPQTTPQVEPNTNNLTAQGGNLGIPATGTYSGATPAAYGPVSTLGDAPATRVTNSLVRRFKPDGWY